MKVGIVRRPEAPTILVPYIRISAVESKFTLADIIDLEPFRKLGAALASNPETELSRTLVSARVVVGFDGMKRTEMVRSTAADHIESAPTLFALSDLKADLIDMVLASPAVPARANQRRGGRATHQRLPRRIGRQSGCDSRRPTLAVQAPAWSRLAGDEQRRSMSNRSLTRWSS